MRRRSTKATKPPARSGRKHAVAPVARAVVGIGASAGGLDAFKKFFGAMPSDSGAAFVLIQHLDPTRESLTAALLGSTTNMPVVQADDGMVVEANHVYVIPPNAYLAIEKGILHLHSPTAPRSLRMAVDFFLRTLADDQHEKAIGIILSGTGTDGTLGLKQVKAEGGMTMVQEPRSAQHDGMPISAISAGHADYILAAEDMPRVLVAYVRHAGSAGSHTSQPPERLPDPLAAVAELLRERTKMDFSGYKKGTLWRRIQRRMSLRHLDDLSRYLQVLRTDTPEATALAKDLLINVTSFFRDPAAWKVLQSQVIRKLVAKLGADDPLRVWIPACSTGEEAYSMAIVLIEAIEATGKAHPMQIFASDIDEEILETARAGIYPEGIAAQVSDQRLSRFFIKTDHRFQVNKELRDAVIFAQQSLIRDPPFSRLDLISCRNLFIYLEPNLQDQLIPLLHFALREGGYLFLGSAEGVGSQEDLFEPVSSKWRIYRRVGPVRRDRLHFPAAPLAREPVRHANLPSPPRLATLAPQLLLQRYAPACVIINRSAEILYFHGRTDDYLAQPSGPPTRDLIAQARQGLRTQLRAAVQESIRNHEKVSLSGVQVRHDKTLRRGKVIVEPLDTDGADTGGLWLVSLEDDPDPASSPGPAVQVAVDPDDATLVQHLELELHQTKDDLQQTIEDLRAANEELMSVNEELQSSNEELETSKEELQSVNEELTTSNTQLEVTIGELAAANDDLDNLLTSTNIATVFLDTQLRIRRFTPAATRLFSLIPSDLGRPIGDIAQKFTDPTLLADAAGVIVDPITPRTEVQGYDGTWYVRQVLPYRTRDNHTEGVVMTFSDAAAEALQEARRYAEAIVDTVREPLLVLDSKARVRSANRSFYDTFRVPETETIGRSLYELGNGEWNRHELHTILGDPSAHSKTPSDIKVETEFPSIGRRIMCLSARAIERGKDRPPLTLLAIEDITERIEAQEALRASEARKHIEEQVQQRQAELARALRISTIGELASGLAHELNQPLSAIANGVAACARYVRSESFNTDALLDLLDSASDEAVRAGNIVEHLRHFIEKGRPQLEATDLAVIASNIPRMVSRELAEQEITLHVDIPTQPIPIHADSIQIEQVIVNLIQNAIDAIRDAPEPPREVTLQVRTVAGRGEVTVRDSGPGVSIDAVNRMFDAFVTTKTQGLGMGLAISRSIVEAHHGRIWVKRRPAGTRGATVCFTLPLVPVVKPNGHRRKS